MIPARKILFLTLRVFSATGGIEKVCRVLGKALYDLSLGHSLQFNIMSMYDATADAAGNPYFPAEHFKGYQIHKGQFSLAAAREGRHYDTIILSHLNLLPVAIAIKKLNPHTRIYLLAHGIEIWHKLPARYRYMLNACEQLLCVSAFTQQVVQQVHHLPAAKTRVLNNCLDPFLAQPAEARQKNPFLAFAGIPAGAQILFTLTRLSSKDRYKGYEKVLEALSALKDQFPKMHYFIGGAYDTKEKDFVMAELKRLDLEQRVTIGGFLAEEDLASFFSQSAIYIMPSSKEGFGIVFVEAMRYGLPVIAGNRDGSVDALAHGKLGLLVDPEDGKAIQNAIAQILAAPENHQPDQQLLNDLFSYNTYKDKLKALLCEA